MEENKTPNADMKTKMTFSDRVIQKIVGIATEENQGVLTVSSSTVGGLVNTLTDKVRATEDMTRGISTEVGEQQVAIDMNVACLYGKNIPEIFSAVTDRVARAVKEQTGLDVVKISMNVSDILTPDEFDQMRASQQGRANEDGTKTYNTPAASGREGMAGAH